MWPNGASNSKHAHRAAQANMEHGMHAMTQTQTNVAPSPERSSLLAAFGPIQGGEGAASNCPSDKNTNGTEKVMKAV